MVWKQMRLDHLGFNFIPFCKGKKTAHQKRYMRSAITGTL